MDDREIAKILRKRNVEYVRHLNKTSPHLESHDELEGGFFSAVAAAARIAARAAAKAVATAAKAAAKAGSQAAKAAGKAAKAAAKAAKAGAKSAAKSARSGSKLDKLDKVMTAADLAQTGYAVAKIAMEKARAGEELSEDEWNDLDPNQQVQIDYKRWARGLNRSDYDLFQSRGGDKSAAIQVVRLMQAGLDPDDWVGNAIESKVESVADAIEDIDDTNPAEDDECLNKLDEDDRSQAERIGLEFAAIGDMGLSQMLSERALEQRQQQRYNFCVEQKTKQLQATRAGLMKELGKGPNDDFDIEDLQVRQHVSDTLAAQNPIMKLALELDGYRAMNGLPKIDISGNVLKDPDNISNDNCEKIASYFIEKQTLDYADQPWIVELLKTDPTIVNRAISRMPFFEYFCSSTPEITAFKNEYVSETIPLTANEILWNNKWDSTTEQYTTGKPYYGGNTVLYNGIPYHCNVEYIVPYTRVPDPNAWSTWTYKMPTPNTKGIQKAQKRNDWLDNVVKDEIDAAERAVQLYDDKEAAQSVTAVFDPTKDYAVGDKVRYANKVYKCTTAQGRGQNSPEPSKWDELSLYNEDDFEALKNIGSATEWVDYKVYPVDTYVTYAAVPNSIWVKIKESAAGIKPDGPEKVWEQIIINNGDLLDLQTNPARRWNATKDYKIDDVVLWNVDLQTYKAIAASKNVRPDDKGYWRQLITFNLDDELAKRLKIEQRAAIFASAVEVAQDFDSDEIYELHDIVCGFDGNYYELIKEKTDKDGDVIAPPIPPNTTYWKLISDGVTVFDPKKQYAINDFVLYEKVYYICTKANTPIGTLPTNVNYWELLDPIFEDLDPEVVASNTERFYDAIINRSEEYQDDLTASYQVGDIIKVFDNDGYPQFYECIKDIPAAGVVSNENKNKAESYNYSKYYNYTQDAIVLQDGVYYKPNAGNIVGRPPPVGWDVIGYEKDPGPPNPEFWKDYSQVDIEDEKLEKVRDNAINGTLDATGIFVGDIVKDPDTGLYYKLQLDPDYNTNSWPANGSKDFGTVEYFAKQVKDYQREPNETDKAFYTRISLEKGPGYFQFPGGFEMPDLPDFTNKKRTVSTVRYGKANMPGVFMWEPQTDIPTEEASKIKNIETASKWRNNKLYKQDDLVTDKYGFKYLCVKDTPYAPMEPYFNQPEYFIQLDEREWDDAIQNARYDIEDSTELSHQYDDIKFSKADWQKPRKQGEIVYHNNKFYKFFSWTGSYYQLAAEGSGPFVPKQKEPGKLDVNDFNAIEYNECDENGTLKILLDTDYPGVDLTKFLVFNFRNGGPIVKLKDKYYVGNSSFREIFGLSGPRWTDEVPEFWTLLRDYHYFKDVVLVEVFQDGKPVNKHDETAAIIGKNVDVSSLPKAQAEAVTATIDKTKDEITCPTAPPDDDDDDDEDTHHEETQAKRDFDKAMIEWKVKGEDPATDPRLIYNQPPPPPPTVGTANGYNIEDLDGNKYHKKTKVRKSNKKRPTHPTL